MAQGEAVSLIDDRARPLVGPDAPTGPAATDSPPAPDRAVSGPGRIRRWGKVGCGALVVIVVVAVPVVVRRDLAATRRQAATARAAAVEAAADRARAERRVEAALDPLDASYTSAIEAIEAREVQRARLVELQLAEDTLDEAVAEAERATAAIEAEEQGLGDEVRQQAVDLPQLEGCLSEVRPLVDAAFLATVNPDVLVPSISPACRALLTAVESR